MLKVSVIIPTFRRSYFIKRAIDSALNQNQVNVEVIVIDDNGKGTEHQLNNERILFDYIESKKIVYVIHEHNKNGSAARNTGIRFSSGDYIAFLDDDDWYDEYKLHNQIKQMDEDRSEACLCSFVRVYNNKESKLSFPIIGDDFMMKLLSFDIDTCAGSSLIVRKELINEIGYFNENFQRFQDLEFLFRISKYTKVSVAISSIVYINMHIDNLRTRKAESILNYHMQYLNAFEEDIIKMDKISQTYIYNRHFTDIAKAFIKNGKIFIGLQWILKTKKPFKTTGIILKDSIKYYHQKKHIKNEGR